MLSQLSHRALVEISILTSLTFRNGLVFQLKLSVINFSVVIIIIHADLVIHSYTSPPKVSGQ